MATSTFGAKIKKDLHDRFNAHFPQYGATKWFIETSLENFLRKLDENPSAKVMLDQAILAMVQENRPDGSGKRAERDEEGKEALQARPQIVTGADGGDN